MAMATDISQSGCHIETLMKTRLWGM